MKLFWFLILLFLMCTCKENKTIKEDNTKEQGLLTVQLSQELYSNLVKYQKLYPFPKSDTGNLYVYVAFFYKEKADTFMNLRRSGEGVSPNKNEKLIGVYSDVNLSSTVIRDSKEFYSKNFIKEPIYDINKLQKFIPITGRDYSEIYPPIYKFKVSRDKLILRSIDTVWGKW